jgi:hypothetical protein
MESSQEILAVLKPDIVQEKKKRKKTEKQLFFKPKAYKNITSTEMKCPKGYKICRCNKKRPKCKKI